MLRSSPEQLEVTQNEEEGEEENLPDPLAVTMREVLLQFPQRVGGEVHVLLLRPLPAGALKLIKVTRPSTEQMLVFYKEGEEEEHQNQPELQNMSLRDFLLQSSQLVNAEVSVLLLRPLATALTDLGFKRDEIQPAAECPEQRCPFLDGEPEDFQQSIQYMHFSGPDQLQSVRPERGQGANRRVYSDLPTESPVAQSHSRNGGSNCAPPDLHPARRLNFGDTPNRAHDAWSLGGLCSIAAASQRSWFHAEPAQWPRGSCGSLSSNQIRNPADTSSSAGS